MKKTLITLSLTTAVFIVLFAIHVSAPGIQDPAISNQAKVIQPDLEKALQRLKAREFLRIIVRLKEQLSPEARRAAFMKGREKADQRKAMVNALRSHAERMQEPILSFLKELESAGLVRRIRPLWISNVIGLEAQAPVIKRIARFPGIEYMKQDIKRPALMQTPAWSVAHINADDVWTNPGLTGNNVVVAVLDSGMDLDHPDLVDRLWINTAEDINNDGQFSSADENALDDDGNGYIDDVIGWDLAQDDNSPDDWHGHGTHVSGSVAGDGTGGTATGVAPDARLMVLGYSGDPYGSGQAEAWEGMEYALDNGADILNFSSGWTDAWNPDYKTWRDNTDVLTDGGVLFVVAAGNDNPHVAVPGDIITPARAPRTIAVGAVDDTDTITTFSAQGPTSWENVTGYEDYIHPPGLLKPDVVGPGASVESTANGGGYVNGPPWSGTSMAAPHVAGTAAILLEEDSTLKPHELKYIIRETAVDLGATGEDNVYGYGRVDTLAAANHNYSHTPVYDLSVTGTNAVWTTTDIWVDNNDDGTPDTPVANTDNHLYARIRNIGGQAVGNVEIKFYYADVGTIGISGFDPNGDGDPDDGNFIYIDSYFVPVIGPSGSSQDTMIGVVNWNVPVPITDHWCVGIGIVAPNPPNNTEINRSNNTAFRNFFNITLTFNQVLVFPFFVYPHPQQPFEDFDFRIDRKALPEQFKVEFAIDRKIAQDWFREVGGLKAYEKPRLKNLPGVNDEAAKRGDRADAYIRLVDEIGVMKNIKAPEGKPVLVYLVIQGPDKKEAEEIIRQKDKDWMLVFNVANGKGLFGGMAIRVELDTRRRRPKE